MLGFVARHLQPPPTPPPSQSRAHPKSACPPPNYGSRHPPPLRYPTLCQWRWLLSPPFPPFPPQVFDDSPLCQWQWLLVAAVVSIPLLQLPTFHETRWAALVVGVMPLVLNVSVMFYEARASPPLYV